MAKESKAFASNLLNIVVVVLIASSVIFSFYKYYIQKDYSLYIKESCDPNYEECLSEECDIEDPRCVLSEDGLMYYKEAYKDALGR